MELDTVIQTMLGLPELNRTETRRNLAKIFALYRRSKLILIMQLEPDIEEVAATSEPGYENAMDPDLVRVNRVESGMPKRWGTRTIDHTRELRRFVRWVDNKVNHLPKEKREIIKRRYLTLDEPLPYDVNVRMSMQDDGMPMGDATYDRHKANALMILAYAFNCVANEDGEHVL